MCVYVRVCVYTNSLNAYGFSHDAPHTLGFVCFLFFCHQHLEHSIDVVSESNLGSFFYETVYNAASTIDYSKEPLDVGIVDSPPPKQIFRQSPVPSPLKGIDCECVRLSPVQQGGSVTPQWRLCMDARPTKSASVPIPLRDVLPLPANSDANARRTKVGPVPHGQPIVLQFFYP